MKNQKEIDTVSPAFLEACRYLMRVHGTKQNKVPVTPTVKTKKPK